MESLVTGVNEPKPWFGRDGVWGPLPSLNEDEQFGSYSVRIDEGVVACPAGGYDARIEEADYCSCASWSDVESQRFAYQVICDDCRSPGCDNTVVTDVRCTLEFSTDTIATVSCTTRREGGGEAPIEEPLTVAAT